MNDKAENLVVRIKPDLRAKIKSAAELEDRTMSSWVRVQLEKIFATKPKVK